MRISPDTFLYLKWTLTVPLYITSTRHVAMCKHRCSKVSMCTKRHHTGYAHAAHNLPLFCMSVFNCTIHWWSCCFLSPMTLAGRLPSVLAQHGLYFLVHVLVCGMVTCEVSIPICGHDFMLQGSCWQMFTRTVTKGHRLDGCGLHEFSTYDWIHCHKGISL